EVDPQGRGQAPSGQEGGGQEDRAQVDGEEVDPQGSGQAPSGQAQGGPGRHARGPGADDVRTRKNPIYRNRTPPCAQARGSFLLPAGSGPQRGFAREVDASVPESFSRASRRLA